MRPSAVSLCDKWLCHLLGSSCKTILLKDLQRIVFESEELVFHKGTSWSVKKGQQIIPCPENQTIHLGGFDLVIKKVHPGMLCCGALVFRKELEFGTSLQCDGVLLMSCERLSLRLKKENDQFHYVMQGHHKGVINGRKANDTGCCTFPALLQMDDFSVFVGCDVVVFTHCAISASIAHTQSIVLPKRKTLQEVPRCYLEPVCECETELILPEFENLPSYPSMSLITMGPMLTMSAASLWNAWLSYQETGRKNSLFLPMVMLVNALLWPCFASIYRTIQRIILKRKRRRHYLSDCAFLLSEIQQLKQQQLKNRIHPETMEEKGMWQIQSHHPDFLQLPLGSGKINSHLHLNSKLNPRQWDDELCRSAAHQLIKWSGFIDGGLKTCDLKEMDCIAFVCNSSLLNEVALRVISAMSVMMDPAGIQHVLISLDERLNAVFRDTALFYQSVIDETVSLKEAIEWLNELSVPCLCYGVDVQNAMKIKRVFKKTKLILFLSDHQPVPSECRKVFVIDEHYNIVYEQVRLLYDNQLLKQHISWLNQHRPEGFPETRSTDFLSQFSHLDQNSLLKQWSVVHDPIALLGVDEEGERILLNLSEHHDGPHGLIAGMTGSGKSVLLLNLLLSTAVHCSPNDVRMLIIDYKGGSLFQQLQVNGKRLPHLIGSLCNQSGGIGRALSSIAYECTRRQRLFALAHQQTGQSVSSLKEYREITKTTALTMLPELLIVVDEFAELKQEEPEFLKTLISLSRIGRSLGLHLILCTQKISGVVDDEILGNTSFKIALKTASASESRELLGTVDASLLNKAGEFVLLSNHLIKKGVCPYCLKPLKTETEVSLINGLGQIIKTQKKTTSVTLRQSDALIELICDAAQQMELYEDHLWLEPLEPFDGVPYLKKKKFFLGLCDCPQIRMQKPLYLNEHDHLLIGYETKAQKHELLQSIVRQLLAQSVCTYYVQLVSNLMEEVHCISSDKDQMQRFLKRMSVFQREPTAVVVDDLNEFVDCFESLSDCRAFVVKASLRNIQLFVLLRKPFSVSNTLMEQFGMKLIFSDLNDAEAMALFHCRRENARVQLSSQAYVLLEEKLIVLQWSVLPKSLKMKRSLQKVDYLSARERKPAHVKNVLGRSIRTLEFVAIHDLKELVVCGMQKSTVAAYCQKMNLVCEMLDVFELQEKYTRKSIRQKNVLWIGHQFQSQMLIPYDLKMRLPANDQEGMVIVNGKLELVRLFDES